MVTFTIVPEVFGVSGGLKRVWYDDGPSVRTIVEFRLNLRDARTPPPVAAMQDVERQGITSAAAQACIPTHTRQARGSQEAHARRVQSRREANSGEAGWSGRCSDDPSRKRVADARTYERKAKHPCPVHASFIPLFQQATAYPSLFHLLTRRATTRCMAEDHSSRCLESPSLRRSALRPSSLRSAYVASRARCHRRLVGNEQIRVGSIESWRL